MKFSMDTLTKADNPWLNLRSLLSRRFSVTQIAANFLGAAACTSYFTFFDEIMIPEDEVAKMLRTTSLLFAVLVVIGFSAHRIWMQKLYRFLDESAAGRKISNESRTAAQKQLLNLPFFSSLVSLFTWLLAGIFMGAYTFVESRRTLGVTESWLEALWIFIGILMAGFVTALVVFFLTEAICRRMIPAFFPDGGATKLTGVFRIHLRTYILMTFFLACFIPMLDMAVLSYNKARMMLVMEPTAVLNSMLQLIIFILVVDTGLVVLLSRMISRSVVDPVEDMQNAMERVESGDLTARAAVFTNNELGSLADNFNQMTEGLRDRYHIRRSLALAREVQLNLLPGEAPRVAGLDVAGRLIYCDETGGDYYDYLWDEKHPDRLDIVIGDVSGHGIPSALLMSSARAYLRQRRALPGELAQVVDDVNREISRDVLESGRFVTLFLLRIDVSKNTLHWVRAGHEPAMLYDPADDGFEELMGAGLPLGVSTNRPYRENRREQFADGQIILLATDGLWESRNPEDEMFGKQRVRSTIRELASQSAADIRDGLLTALAAFAGDQKPEDDITLVVVKARQPFPS